MGKHATQTAYPWRTTARTVFQAFVGFCFLAPAIYAAATGGDPLAATGYAAAGLAFTGAVTRIMAIPGFDAWMRKYVPFLASEPRTVAPSALPLGSPEPVMPLGALEPPTAPGVAAIGDIPAAGEAAE